MVRRKSILSKIRTRKESYKRKLVRLKVDRSWRILFLIIKAVFIFSRTRRKSTITASLTPGFSTSYKDLIPSNCVGFLEKEITINFAMITNIKEEFDNFMIIQDIIKKVVSTVCRRESDRRIKSKIRKKKILLDAIISNERSCITRTSQRNWFKEKYSKNILFRKQKQDYAARFFRDTYKSNIEFREKHKTRFLKKYCNDVRFRDQYKLRSKKNYSDKYHNNTKFRDQCVVRARKNILEKYHNNMKFRDQYIVRAKKNMLDKYYNNADFRETYKTKMREQVLDKYNSNNMIRLKTIARALNRYRANSSPAILNQRRLYNQSRRIIKKYIVFQSHKCANNHRILYMNNLKKFRKIIQEGPDCVCVSCHLALFRNQVIPYVEEKYIKESMSYEVKECIKSYLSHSFITRNNWICKSCSDKIKKRQMPSRAIVNKLEVIEIPFELKNLNNLEKHLIALRLPFMQIVNLSSGKVSSKFAQKGTKGPLHCVPSDVQDTVTVLPRPIDKSMMIRLQLKRRLKYKAVWEEQFINPNDVRDALTVLTKINSSYKKIKINEIDNEYLTSDRDENMEDTDKSLSEVMDVDNIEESDLIEKTALTNEDRLKKIALGDVDEIVDDEHRDDEEIAEDDTDIRSKYNIGTDSCTQPTDFNDFQVFDKEPSVVAPAEKNNLSSLLTDKTIEALAFPHLFPDGRGSYDEDRVVNLKWKEYCKARLFSSDSRFASDSSYIFFLQYLGDLKQVFSGINVAFRKKLPITVKQSLDETQMKFLMNKDMIYRYLQSVRGSPQYWHQRLKDLFGMNRQLSFSTFFLTLSCADLRWKEFVDIFARHAGEKVKELYTFEEKTKLLRNNPVLAARLFERRFNNFMNLFIRGGAYCMGKVQDWFARIEMQFRGSPHAHMPVWVEDAPKYNGPDTDKKTRDKIVKFCDKYITTRFPSIDEDTALHNIIKEVQTHSRNHSKSCLKYHKTMCRFGFLRPVARHTFICEPIKIDNNDDKQCSKKTKEILSEMNATMNALEKEKILFWSDFDNLLLKYNWTYDDYECALRIVHTRPTIIHKREPNARWVNQYNEEILRAWDANMDIQFVLDPYACAKYLMSYTTKPEREMSLLLEETHKECREGNMSVREEMKKLTGTFFNHRQVSVQEAIYRATTMPLTYSSRGFVFVPAHSNSCRFLKSHSVLKDMDPDDDNIYMSNLADKYFDRPTDSEFDICMADFASHYEIVSIKKNVKKPKTPIKRLQTLAFAVKKRCGRNAIIRYPYFNRETDRENYYENLLCLYLPIRSRNNLKKPYELFYETGEVFDVQHQIMRKVKDIVCENRKKYEAHFKETDEMESLFNQLSRDMKENEWAEIVADKEKSNLWLKEAEQEDNPDLNVIHKTKSKNTFFDLKPRVISTDEIKPLLESMNAEQQQVFYHVREWCIKRLQNPDVEPLRLFITGGAGTGKSHLLKCLHHEAMKIFSRKKHLAPDENIDEIHTLITAFTGAAAVNVGGVTIHSAFGIGTQPKSLSDNLSCDKLNSYRCKLGSLKLLFVDEVSLIQSSLWGAMHARLTQIMGVHSNTTIFGNIGVIAIGDFYQCSPVAAQGIYSSLLWSDHFEYIELKINERQKTNNSFAEMLNRIRKLKKKEKMTEEDRKTLETCHQRYLNKEYHPEALHLFAKNVQVDEHNDKMLDIICTDIRTFYELDRNDREIQVNKNQHRGKSFRTLRLAKNARVMITKNIAVVDGLANGVMGRIVDFVENENKNISRIIIKCDLLTVGRLHRVHCVHCHGKDTVCVIRENDNIDRHDNDFGTKKSTKQFPLRLSWATTIHKAQGVTVDQVVMSTKDLFGTGMGYTGFTRVRIKEGLFLSNLHLDKIYCNEYIDAVLSQMKVMKFKPSVFQDSSQFINIFCHNVEGLKCNFLGLRNHYLTNKADIICLSETWLNEKNIDFEQFRIQGYNFFYKTRFASFELNHPLKSQKGGGGAIYLKDNLCYRQIESSKQLNLEYLSIKIEKYNITVITCYRSPQQSKNEFLINLTDFLQEINMQKKILLLGDLNEDTLDDKIKPIESKIESFGFINLFKGLPTTKCLTSLDCVYSNFISNRHQYKEVTRTYYSFHDPLILSIDVEDKSEYINKDNLLNSQNNMEIDIPSSSSTSPSIDYQTTMKRKRISTKKNSKRVLKEVDVLSPINNKKCSLKENQIHFLENTDKISKTNDLQNLSSTFTLSEQLGRIGFKKINIIADGNCFFRGVSHQILRNENDHLNLRSETIRYLHLNKNDFEGFLNLDVDPTIEHYIQRMSRNGTYADYLTLIAAAIVIKKNIIVHEKGKTPLCIPGCDFIDEQIHLGYDPNILHYDSVVSINGDSAFLSSEQVILL